MKGRFIQTTSGMIHIERKRKEHVIGAEEFGIRLKASPIRIQFFRLGDTALSKSWIGVDENLLQVIVLGSSKPASAREIDHQISLMADRADFSAGLAVVATRVVDIGPCVFETDDLKVLPNIARRVSRVGADPIGNRIKPTFTRILKIKYLVSEVLEASDIMQCTPRHAPHWVTSNDAS